MTGLEQFHQGKSDDETHRSPLEASQSQVHRAEGSADDRPAQARCSECAQGRSRSECHRNWIDCNPFAFLRSLHDYEDFCSHRFYRVCRHLYLTGPVAESA
jgi:hypothetical protein